MNHRRFFFAMMFLMISLCSCGKPASSESPEDARESDCMVRYEKTDSKEIFYVAVKDEYRQNIWFVFRLNHYRNLADLQYMNLWRVDWAYKGKWDKESGTMTNILDKILTDGESESVFKDYGTGVGTSEHVDTYDFTGGFHGDERIDVEDGSGVTFFIDGKTVSDADLLSSFDWKECSSFSYEQTSTMHKTALKVDGEAVISDHHVVADHFKRTEFKDSGYITHNTITFRESIPFYWYSGICCVGTAVAERGCNETMSSVSFDRSGANRLDETGRNEYHAWCDANEIEVNIYAEMLKGGEDLQNRMFVWDTKNYAKFYRRYPSNGYHQTSDGEAFESQMKVEFSCR